MILKLRALAFGDTYATSTGGYNDVWINMDSVSTATQKATFVEVNGLLVPTQIWENAVHEYHAMKYNVHEVKEDDSEDAPSFIEITSSSRKSAVDWLTQHGYTVMDDCVLWFEGMLPQNWKYNNIHELLFFAAQKGWSQ